MKQVNAPATVPVLPADVRDAIQSIELGNNGYANIGNDECLARAVIDQGYSVIRSRDLHGHPVFKGFTKAAQAALRQEPFGVSNYGANLRSSPMMTEGPDYEEAILARQEAMFEF